MDRDNFRGQLDRNYRNNRKFLYKANNVSIALSILIDMNLINENTLVVFDLDGTLFVSNANELDREDVLLPEIRDNFVEIFRRLRRLSNHTGIITGRNEIKRPITERSLQRIGLEFNSSMIHFTNNKSTNLREILERFRQINNVIYFDDFILNNGVHDTIRPLMRQFNFIKFIGIKVGEAPEFVLDDISEQFNEDISADLNIELNGIEGRILSRLPPSTVVPRPAPPPVAPRPVLPRPVPPPVAPRPVLPRSDVVPPPVAPRPVPPPVAPRPVLPRPVLPRSDVVPPPVAPRPVVVPPPVEQQNTVTLSQLYSSEVNDINLKRIKINKTLTVVKTPANETIRKLRLNLLRNDIISFIQDFNRLSDSNQAQIEPFDEELITFLRENLPEIMHSVPRILLPPIQLRVPKLSLRGYGDVERSSFFSADEDFFIIKPVRTFQLSEPHRFRIFSGGIDIDILPNGKLVMQQISEVSCFITTLTILLTDNGYNIEDPKIASLLKNKLTGNKYVPEAYGTRCEELDDFIESFKLHVPGKYILHNFFHSVDFDYDVAYFQNLIARYGSLIIIVSFRPGIGGGSHSIILDSIDKNNAEIREPFHGYAFRMQTRILINRKLRKNNNKYEFTFLSNNKHTQALTNQEEKLRLS